MELLENLRTINIFFELKMNGIVQLKIIKKRKQYQILYSVICGLFLLYLYCKFFLIKNLVV